MALRLFDFDDVLARYGRDRRCVAYKPNEDASLYAFLGVATLSPGSWLSNPGTSCAGNSALRKLVGQNSRAAKPQRSVNQEAGVTWSFFDDRLSTSAALFQAQRRRVATTRGAPAIPRSPNALSGDGMQADRGLELGAVEQLSDAWTILAGAV